MSVSDDDFNYSVWFEFECFLVHGTSNWILGVSKCTVLSPAYWVSIQHLTHLCYASSVESTIYDLSG